MTRNIPSPLPFFRQKIAFGSAGELHTTESENPAMAIRALPRPLDRMVHGHAAPTFSGMGIYELQAHQKDISSVDY